MHSFEQVKILPYTPKDIADLVLDVESYPKFLPWCSAARIISKDETRPHSKVASGSEVLGNLGTQDRNVLNIHEDLSTKLTPQFTAEVEFERRSTEIIAELVISFKGFVESYRSRITTEVTEELYIIKVEAISGPFKYLHNNWKIKRIERESEVDFFIEFSFNSTLLNSLIGIFFKSATEKMIDAFEERAHQILKSSS